MPKTIESLLCPVSGPDAYSSRLESAFTPSQPIQVHEPDDELVVSAKHKLTLRCGKSSITLHPNGKIVLRGEYILSDAEGVNRISGGRVELN